MGEHAPEPRPLAGRGSGCPSQSRVVTGTRSEGILQLLDLEHVAGVDDLETAVKRYEPRPGARLRAYFERTVRINDSARERHGLFRCGALGAACVAVHRSNIREWHPPRPEWSLNVRGTYRVPLSVGLIRIA
jgi:hypothetical protein